MASTKSVKAEVFALSNSQLAKFKALNPSDGFRNVDPEHLRGIIPKAPETYLGKCNTVLLITSGGTSYYSFGATIFRVDGNEIDQDQILVVVDREDPNVGRGMKLSHGDYPGRTSPQSPEFQTGLLVSGIPTTAPIPALPDKESGSLEELAGDERASFDYAEQFVGKYVKVALLMTKQAEDKDTE